MWVFFCLFVCFLFVCLFVVVVVVVLLVFFACLFVCLFFGVPQLYLWGSPFLGEIFAYVTVCFLIQPLR